MNTHFTQYLRIMTVIVAGGSTIVATGDPFYDGWDTRTVGGVEFQIIPDSGYLHGFETLETRGTTGAPVQVVWSPIFDRKNAFRMFPREAAATGAGYGGNVTRYTEGSAALIFGHHGNDGSIGGKNLFVVANDLAHRYDNFVKRHNCQPRVIGDSCYIKDNRLLQTLLNLELRKMGYRDSSVIIYGSPVRGAIYSDHRGVKVVDASGSPIGRMSFTPVSSQIEPEAHGIESAGEYDNRNGRRSEGAKRWSPKSWEQPARTTTLDMAPGVALGIAGQALYSRREAEARAAYKKGCGATRKWGAPEPIYQPILNSSGPVLE